MFLSFLPLVNLPWDHPRHMHIFLIYIYIRLHIPTTNLFASCTDHPTRQPIVQRSFPYKSWSQMPLTYQYQQNATKRKGHRKIIICFTEGSWTLPSILAPTVGKGKIIFKRALGGDMLVPSRVYTKHHVCSPGIKHGTSWYIPISWVSPLARFGCCRSPCELDEYLQDTSRLEPCEWKYWQN